MKSFQLLNDSNVALRTAMRAGFAVLQPSLRPSPATHRRRCLKAQEMRKIC